MISPEQAEKIKKSYDDDIYQAKFNKASKFIEGELIKGNRKIKVDDDRGIFSILETYYDRFDVILECWDSLYEVLREAGWNPRLTIHKYDHWFWGSSHYLEIVF